jgi:hypothetical protein
MIALTAAVTIVALTALYLPLTAEKGAPSYTPGSRWTWQVTRQELDPLTNNVIATRTYSQTIEYVGEGTRGGYRGGIFKLTMPDRPTQYGKIFRVTEGNEIRELMSESFENDRKISEYSYLTPILFRKFPLRVGLRFSDAKAVSGYDNAAGVQSINAFETRVTEVVAKETLMLPAAIDTYKLRGWGTSTGTMRTEDVTSQIIITREENLWYSESIKEVVRSVSETTTVVATPFVTSVTRTREKRVLTSYSLK